MDCSVGVDDAYYDDDDDDGQYYSAEDASSDDATDHSVIDDYDDGKCARTDYPYRIEQVKVSKEIGAVPKKAKPIKRRRLATAIDNSPRSRKKYGLPPLDVYKEIVTKKRSSKSAETLFGENSPASTNSTTPIITPTPKISHANDAIPVTAVKIKAVDAISKWNVEKYVCELEAQALGSDSPEKSLCLPFDGRVPIIKVVNCTVILSKYPSSSHDIPGECIEELERIEEDMKNPKLKSNQEHPTTAPPISAKQQQPESGESSEQEVVLLTRAKSLIKPRKRKFRSMSGPEESE